MAQSSDQTKCALMDLDVTHGGFKQEEKRNRKSEKLANQSFKQTTTVLVCLPGFKGLELFERMNTALPTARRASTCSHPPASASSQPG